MGIWIGPFLVGDMDRPLSSWGYADHVEEIKRQIQECINAGLVLEYKKGEYPSHCPSCCLMAKPGSTALCLVVDYGELNKHTQNHSGSLPNMEHNRDRIS